VAKTDTTPPCFEQGVLNVLAKAGVALPEVGFFAHGTTVVINALTERKGTKVGLITTEGFRDVLEIGRGNRPDFFNMLYEKPPAFVPRHLRREVAGRLDYKGAERAPLNLSPLAAILDDFRAAGVGAIAICFLHAYANPAHEAATLAEVQRLWPGVPVVASHQITREWREYERTSTTVLSAYVQPVAERYLTRLREGLAAKDLQAPVFVMQSNCGIDTLERAARVPVTMVESGPASGVWAAAELGRLIGAPNVLALDIGGTTAKCSLIEGGTVKVMTDYWIERSRLSAGYPIMVPVVDLVEIGNGGGSIAQSDAFGKLHVGPQSAGAMPGPAAYGRGGKAATTTDANLWLGRINPEYFCGGEVLADMAAAGAALQALGARIGLDATGTARAIVRIANANMAGALKLVSVNRGHDPRDFIMVAFGGGGAMHAVALAQELGVRKVVIPAGAAVFSAWGMLMCDLRRDLFLTRLMDLFPSNAAALTALCAEAEADATRAFAEDGIAATPTFRRLGRLRYQNQEHTIEVEIPASLDIPALEAAFHTAYEKEYTYRLNAPVEVVGLHLIAVTEVGKLSPKPRPLGPTDASPARKGSRQVDFAEDGIHAATLYDGTKLHPGMAFQGPAVVEDPGTTVVIHPGNRAHLDTYGNLHIEVRP
jgi:N-methylhydantoinase A